MWTGLRIHYPIIAGRRREKRAREEGEWRKMGGGKIGRRGNEENSVRAAPKKRGGGETRGGRYKFTMRIIFKGTRNILTRLTHLNYFFGFVLADFTLLTWILKKMFIYFFIFLNKRVHILYKVPISVWKCTIMYLYSEKYSGGGPPDSPFFTCIYCLRVCFKNALFKNEPWGIFCYYYSPPPKNKNRVRHCIYPIHTTEISCMYVY